MSEYVVVAQLVQVLVDDAYLAALRPSGPRCNSLDRRSSEELAATASGLDLAACASLWLMDEFAAVLAEASRSPLTVHLCTRAQLRPGCLIPASALTEWV